MFKYSRRCFSRDIYTPERLPMLRQGAYTVYECRPETLTYVNKQYLPLPFIGAFGGLFLYKFYLFPLIPLALLLRTRADIIDNIQATAEKIELMPDGKNIRVKGLGGKVRECPIDSLRNPTDEEMSKINPVFG